MTSTIPDLTYGIVKKSGTDTQFGCVYCLAENLEAPSERDVVYMWAGTTMCATHVKQVAQSQQKAQNV